MDFYPRHEVTIAPRETLNVQVVFSPLKRVPNFSEELMIRYAGLTRKLLVVSGKAQGNEVALGKNGKTTTQYILSLSTPINRSMSTFFQYYH